MTKYKYPKLFLFFLIAVMLQLRVVPLIEIENVVPDLVIIVLVYSVLSVGQFYGTMLGFTYGLFFDLFSGGILGTAMFSKTVAGFVTGYFFNENKIDFNTRTYVFVLIVFIIATIDSILYTALSSAAPKSFFVLVLFGGIFPGAFTALISFPMVMFNNKKYVE